MKKWSVLITLVILLAAFLGLFTEKAFAIAAFARKYGTDCTACHTNGGWRLNKEGQDFLRYGHMNEGEGLGEKWFDYLSFSTKIRLKGGEDKIDTFETHAFSIYTAGALGGGVSYFVEQYIHENSGKNTGDSDFGDYGRSKLAEAYIQVTRGDMERYFTTRIGSIMPQLLAIHSVGPRTTQSRPYVVSSATIGGNPYRPRARQYGLDVAYHANNFHTVLGVVNGTGHVPHNVVDVNESKDLFLTVDYNFDDYGSKLGFYGYDGKYPLVDAATGASFDDDFEQFGLVGNWTREKYGIVGTYLVGENTVDSFDTKQDSEGFFLEVAWYAKERLDLFARYDDFDPNTDVAGDGVDGFLVGASWRFHDFARLVGEARHFGGDEKKDTYIIEINLMF